MAAIVGALVATSAALDTPCAAHASRELLMCVGFIHATTVAADASAGRLAVTAATVAASSDFCASMRVHTK